jgi:hypothetical protein
MIDTFINHVTGSLWPTELAEFGSQVNYWPSGDFSNAVAVAGVWIDGADDEDVSPGRYSRLKVSNADLPADPAEGDMVESDDHQFDVVAVVALPYNFSILTLHETGVTP